MSTMPTLTLTIELDAVTADRARTRAASLGMDLPAFAAAALAETLDDTAQTRRTPRTEAQKAIEREWIARSRPIAEVIAEARVKFGLSADWPDHPRHRMTKEDWAVLDVVHSDPEFVATLDERQAQR